MAFVDCWCLSNSSDGALQQKWTYRLFERCSNLILVAIFKVVVVTVGWDVVVDERAKLVAALHKFSGVLVVLVRTSGFSQLV